MTFIHHRYQNLNHHHCNYKRKYNKDNQSKDKNMDTDKICQQRQHQQRQQARCCRSSAPSHLALQHSTVVRQLGVKDRLWTLGPLVLKLWLLVLALPGVSASGRLVEPTMRSSRWRFDPEAPVNYNDQGLNCGGLQVSFYMAERV